MRCFVACILFVLVCDRVSSDSDFEDKWLNATAKLAHVAHPFKREFAQFLDEVVRDDTVRITDKCRHALANFSTGIMSDRFEDMVLFDSFSKVKPGLLTFQGYNFGSYDQCLAYGRYVYMGMHFPLPPDSSVMRIQSKGRNDWKYNFSVSIGIRKLHPFHFAVCVPVQCFEEDLRTIVSSSHVTQVTDPLTISILTTEALDDPVSYTWTQVTAMLLLAFIVNLGINGTVLCYLFPDWTLVQRLAPFDLYANAVDLFAPEKYPDSMFTTINAFRATYFFSSVITHVVIGINLGSQFLQCEASVSLRESIRSPVMTMLLEQAIRSIPVMMTVNVALASCFTAVKWIPAMSRGSVHVVSFATERMFRSLPVVAAYLLIVLTLPLVQHGGPMSKYSQQAYRDMCSRTGWKELLFVNNFGDLRHICMPIAWFMSAEFQLYMASFVVLLLIAKLPGHAVRILVGQVVVGIVASAAAFLIHRTPPISYLRIVDVYYDITTFTTTIYHTYNYISAYAIGMLLGCQLLRQGGQVRRTTKPMYAVAMTGGLLMNLLPGMAYDEEAQFRYGLYLEVAYAALIRPFTAAVYSLWFYLLFNSRNPILLWIARSRVVAVVTRLSLSWFVVHAMFLVLMIGSFESSGLQGIMPYMQYVYIIVISFLPACAMHLFVEAPFSKLLLPKKKRDVKKE